MAQRELISGRRLAWLQQEREQWRSAGLVDQAGAEAIGARYQASSRARADGEVRCGIESYFASQANAKRLERELGRRGAIARVKIDGAGRAALVDLEPR